MVILNFDETCLVQDGGKFGNCLSFAQSWKSGPHSLMVMTMVARITASGEAIPPFMQFSTTAQSIETM